MIRIGSRACADSQTRPARGRRNNRISHTTASVGIKMPDIYHHARFDDIMSYRLMAC